MPSICLHSCDLVLKTNNDAVIRGVVVFGEQIFEEESLFLYPRVREQDVALMQHSSLCTACIGLELPQQAHSYEKAHVFYI